MIKPIQPYAIKGVLWYQGESITEGLPLYPVVMEHVITGWREQWGQGDFPFYFVQLAAQDANSNRPEVREAQAEALKVPNTAMAVAMDIGEKTNVHPRNKQDLADRLARIARANAYGEKIESMDPCTNRCRSKGTRSASSSRTLVEGSWPRAETSSGSRSPAPTSTSSMRPRRSKATPSWSPPPASRHPWPCGMRGIAGRRARISTTSTACRHRSFDPITEAVRTNAPTS